MESPASSPKRQRTADVEECAADADAPAAVDLGHDSLINVFMYLPIYDRVRCERVCRSWRAAARASWYKHRRLDLREKSWGEKKSVQVYYAHLRKVLSRCGKYVTELDLDGTGESRVYGRSYSLGLLAMCPNLKALDLGRIRIGVPQLRVVLKSCSSLESLTLGYLTSKVNDFLLTDYLFSKFKLKCFRLTNSPCIQGHCFKALCPELVEEISLHIDAGSSARRFWANSLPQALASFKKLHTLRLPGILDAREPLRAWLHSNARSANVAKLFHCLSHLENLRVLDLSRNRGHVNDENVRLLAPLRDRLTTLDVSATSVTDQGLWVLTQSPSMENLSLRYLHTVVGHGLGDMPRLKSLDVFGCSRLREDQLIRAIGGSEDLSYVNVVECTKVTTKLIEAVKSALKYRTRNKGSVQVDGIVLDRNDDDDGPRTSVRWWLYSSPRWTSVTVTE